MTWIGGSWARTNKVTCVAGQVGHVLGGAGWARQCTGPRPQRIRECTLPAHTRCRPGAYLALCTIAATRACLRYRVICQLVNTRCRGGVVQTFAVEAACTVSVRASWACAGAYSRKQVVAILALIAERRGCIARLDVGT